MRIRPLVSEDREKLRQMIIRTSVFTDDEVGVAMELIDIVIGNKNQKDYTIVCTVDGHNEPAGYVCYGPVPMTQGTFDLYWIVIDPKVQGQKIGSELLDYMEREIRELQGRMILADTSSIPSYEKANRFYLKRGFKEVARIADYYWKGNDRITYCKKLT
ncbi:MAG: GNAT family N-acetyltransferase [Deltaproteobacteria bacterium]|nr:GNAT family N-acetyltransferase [Deltaproteobacteria bacterium]